MVVKALYDLTLKLPSTFKSFLTYTLPPKEASEPMYKRLLTDTSPVKAAVEAVKLERAVLTYAVVATSVELSVLIGVGAVNVPLTATSAKLVWPATRNAPTTSAFVPTVKPLFIEASPTVLKVPPTATSVPTFKRELREASPATNNLLPSEASEPINTRELREASPATNKRAAKDASEAKRRRAFALMSPTKLVAPETANVPPTATFEATDKREFNEASPVTTRRAFKDASPFNTEVWFTNKFALSDTSLVAKTRLENDASPTVDKVPPILAFDPKTNREFNDASPVKIMRPFTLKSLVI